MTKRVSSGPRGSVPAQASNERGVVDFADARVRLRTKHPSQAELMEELDEVRTLLDQGLSTEARNRLTLLMASARNNVTILAMARCALSSALEMQGHYRESLAAVAMYETPESRAGLDVEVVRQLRVQLGLAYNYNGDHPKAIAILKAALRDFSENSVDGKLGSIYAALARVYRTISEYPIARDYGQRALEHFRQTGEWRGLAEAYFGVALADTQEGNYESGLENFAQALKLIGDHPASYLLGRIYANMAGACWFLKRPQEGIRYLEKAISYYERTDHKTNAADGYNNLGINLILIGQWGRAQEALERALSLASEVDERGIKIPMILDSLGELHMLRGELDEGKSYLQRAVSLATENGNKWYACQALRTLGRCYLAMQDEASALSKAKEALELAEVIGDRQAICESRLLLAEAHLRKREFEECAAELHRVTEQVTDSPTDLGIAGESQRLAGMLVMEQGDATAAAQHFGSSVSVFDMLGDRYRAARAYYELGLAYSVSQPNRALEQLSRAVHTFRDLGAALDLGRAEEAIRNLDQAALTPSTEQSALTQLLTLRLAEAVASRELLLRELAAIMRQETTAQRILICEEGEHRHPRVVIAHGLTTAESIKIATDIYVLDTEEDRERYARKYDAVVIPLRSSNAPPGDALSLTT